MLRNPAAKYLLALAWMLTYQSAAQLKAQDENPATAVDYESLIGEGRSLLEQGDAAGALTIAEQATSSQSLAASGWLLKGDALKELENFAEAALAYKEATDRDDTLAEAYNGWGESLLETERPGDMEFALEAFSRAVNLDSDNPNYLSNLGHVQLGVDPSEALRLLTNAVDLGHEDSRTFRDLALANSLLGDVDESVLYLQRAIDAEPEDYENYIYMAQIKSVEEDYAAAVDALTKAIETYKPKKRMDPDNFVAGYLRRADALVKLGNTFDNESERETAYRAVIDDANKVLELAEDQFPNNGAAYYWRGRAERLLENYSAAINSFTRCIQTAPPGQPADFMSSAYLYRGICWYKQESLDLARLDFIEAKSIGSGFGDPRIYLWLGFTYHQEGKYRQAIDAYGEAAAQNPAFAIAYVNQGLAYAMLEEYQKAVESFNKAIRAEPLEPEHFYRVGLAQLKLGECQKAVYAFDNALQIKPDDTRYLAAMAAALRCNGEESLADTYSQRAGQAAP